MVVPLGRGRCASVVLALCSAALAAARPSSPFLAGDVLLRAGDLSHPRVIRVQPGHRVLLVEEWPRGAAEGGGPRQGAPPGGPSPPAILHAWSIPEAARGVLTHPELPNVTVHAVRFDDLVRRAPRRGAVASPGLEEDIAKIVDRALVDMADVDMSKISSEDEYSDVMERVQEVTDRLDEVLLPAFPSGCIDEAVFVSESENILDRVLGVLTADMRRLSWFVRYTSRPGYVVGGELCLVCSSFIGMLQLRVHIWHNFNALLQLDPPYNVGTHGHAYSMFVSRQISGTVEQLVQHQGGQQLPSPPFRQRLSHLDRSRGESSAQQVMGLDGLQPMHGTAVSIEEGTAYTMPPRWNHAVFNTTDAVTVEMRVWHSWQCERKLPVLLEAVRDEVPEVLEEFLSGSLDSPEAYYGFLEQVAQIFRDGPRGRADHSKLVRLMENLVKKTSKDDL